MKEYGKYCGEHPLTQREILPNGLTGLTISGIECEHRIKTPAYGWQSFCSRFDRIKKGCEKS